MTLVAAPGIAADAPKLQEQAGALTRTAAALQVVDAESFVTGGELLKDANAYLKRVAEVFDPIDRAQIEARRVTIEQRKKLEAPAVAVKEALGKRLADYEKEQQRLRREEEERQRQERERLEAEERERVRQEQERLQREAEERALEEAAAAEAAGDTELAERIVATPPVVETPAPRPVFTPPALVRTPPKVEGVSFRDNWSAEVHDLAALVKAAAADPQYLGYLVANQTALNGVARALKDNLRIPGVRSRNDRTTSARA